MAIELHLQKTTKTPWGFRLAGGAEYEVPLTVIKVTENSIAENAGMQEGDVIVRIKDIPTAELTHNEAHDILLNAGDDFVLAVRRGNLSNLPPRLLLYETSVENAEDMVDDQTRRMQVKNGNAKENESDLNITDEEIVNIIGEQVQISSQKAIDKSIIKMEEIKTSKEEVKQEITEEISVVHKQSEVAKVIFSEESQKTEEKKWSAFLVKPKNPKPVPKAKEPEGPKAPPYRVIIKKQPKKDQQTSQEISNIEEKELESKHITVEQEEISNSTEDVTLEHKIDSDENEENVNTDKIEDEQNEFREDENEGEEENETSERARNEEKEETQTSTEEKQQSSTEKRLSINLEEQLAQVRQQLEALAQLPSAIQQTLSAVTQQLTEIALAKHVQEQEIIAEAKVTVHEETTEEYLEVSDYEEKALSILEEESCEHYEEEIKEEIREEALESMRNESEEEQALFEELEKQIEEEEERKRLEELEARKTEQERIQKKDKERRSSLPRTPLQRPIILPGGRKWSNPDDATPKIRRPSMTDDKIANTINMFSEVIVGRIKGINFLKYQPPPKTLDHLQHSAVYRLVHDIEPPPRGVIARDGKVLAEQDYYAEKREGEN